VRADPGPRCIVPGMVVPEDLRYTSEHEWVRSAAEGRVRVGITDYAQDALGDVVFVSLPELGAKVPEGGVLGEVESTKSVSEIYAPVAGEVAAVNTSLSDAPEKLNSDPYGEGWICEITPSDRAALDSLLDAGAYTELIAT
jgi:glycine cleavage system H protein